MSVLGSRLRRALRWARSSKWDIVWVVFVGLNLAAMRLLPGWQTVPFLAIWVSLTLIYGFRLWRLQPAILTLMVLTLATGGIIGIQVIRGQQDADYLAEVPLIALMFLVMVWHGQRRLNALEERLGALDEVERVSRENLRLLEQQRMFLLDASHELGTPITVALGHAELIEQAAADKERSSRTPESSSASWGGCARWRPGCCCWPPRAAPASLTWDRWRPTRWSWKRWTAGATPRAAGGSVRWPTRPSRVTATGWPWRWTP